MKKKIFQILTRCCCLAAACCLILAGAAAPLTVYAAEDDGSGELDVAQETRTLSGTWRWNDEIDLSLFPGMAEFPLEFMVPSFFTLDEETGLLVVSHSPVYFDVIMFVPPDPSAEKPTSMIAYGGDGTSIFPVYIMPSVIDPEALPEELELMGWRGAAVMFSVLGSLGEIEIQNIDAVFGWGQTIRIPVPQEIPVVFYEWFTANATRIVSPTERLMEGLSAVGTGIWTGVSGVANTITTNPLLLFTTGFLFLGGCIGLFGRLLSRS